MGLTQLDVAKSVGVSEATVSRWESGDIANMRRDRIAKLADVLNIAPIQIMGWPDQEGTPSYPDNIIPMPNMRQIPLVGTIACGTPILAVENIEDYVDLPEHVHADFALICKGDSMINARIFDGDVVYIKKQSMVENGEIAAVLIGEEATLKRVHLYPDRITLEAANPTIAPRSYWNEDMDEVRILGKAVAFTSAIR